jgi:hypothetical protein
MKNGFGPILKVSPASAKHFFAPGVLHNLKPPWWLWEAWPSAATAASACKIPNNFQV